MKWWSVWKVETPTLAGTHQSPSALDRYRQECSTLFRATPEQLAHDAGLALNEGGIDDGTEGNEGAVAIARGRVHFTNKSCGASLFSVNLGEIFNAQGVEDKRKNESVSVSSAWIQKQLYDWKK